MLERSDKQLARLDRLVGDLLDVSRIQTGKLELRREPCNMRAIVPEVVQEQRAAWPHRQITYAGPRQAHVPLYADGDRIGQVVTNLLTNALKYSPDASEVALTLRVPGDRVYLRVRDHGPGLTAAQQEHLFEQFYRVPAIEQQSGSGIGLGLGLYICKTIVERHGGSMGLESAPGDGSTLWFGLPVMPATPP